MCSINGCGVYLIRTVETRDFLYKIVGVSSWMVSNSSVVRNDVFFFFGPLSIKQQTSTISLRNKLYILLIFIKGVEIL
jgi:hypothetical protein